MVRTRRSQGFTALRIQGGILPSEFLQAISAQEAPRQVGIDYGLSKSLELKDELARYWRIANDLYARYSERRARQDLIARQVGVDEWLMPLLRSILGYDDLTTTNSVTQGGQVFKLTHRACSGAVPLVLVTSDFDLDKANARFGIEGRRQAPHGLMQEYLNIEDASLWGIVSNGSKLRILRDNPSLTRPSYIEADLDLVFTEELYPDFAALWLAIHASRLKPETNKPSSCIIETWRAKAHETGERALNKLRNGVTEALRQIGNGFLQHPYNTELRGALESGALSTERYFQQLLALVYRLLFLFAAEERDLLHVPNATAERRAVYEEGYALSRLQERALRRRYYDRHWDIWQGLQITFRALAHGAPALGVPALGGLFNREQCPTLDTAAITNERLLEAIRNLSFFRSGNALARVNYRDMGTEELGSVYESLLELHPVVEVNATPWTFGFIGDGNDEKAKGSERKLTGSYYTPSTLVNELIKSTLEPVLVQASADRPEDPRGAILSLKVLDPACGSGHFLLAAARRMATEIMRIESGSDTSDEVARQHALREVVQHCIYGVDRNPFAVELCKTALWIETVEPGKPLTFLDSHIQLGDSLVGILDPGVIAGGVPNKAFKSLTGDDKVVCQALMKRNRQISNPRQLSLFDEESVSEVAAVNADVDAMPEDTLRDIERKSVAWKNVQQDKARTLEELRANLFVAPFFAEKTQGTRATVADTEDLNRLRIGMPPRPGVEAAVCALARQHRFLHWHIAFAEIMQSGGFDVVLGNPPWKVSQLMEVEYFAARAPSIASLSGARRKEAIAALRTTNPEMWRQYQRDLRVFDARNAFCRWSGRYWLGNFGKLNSYALFSETFLQLTKPTGQAGLIVPTGISTDDSTKKFFAEIVTTQRLVSLYDFENRKAIFPGVHRSYKFCLLTLTGSARPCPEAEFAFFLHHTEQLVEKERRFTLSAADFALFKPNTRTCPIFRTYRDMEIARKMYRRAGVLWKEKRGQDLEDNPWCVSFQQMFNMTSDSGLFQTREQLEEGGWELEGNVFVRDDQEERYLPLYEAKLFHQYDHRFATFDGVSAKDRRNGKARPMTSGEKADPETVVVPRYWVPEEEVTKRLNKVKMTQSLSLPPPPPPPPPRKFDDSQNWLATRSQEYYPGDRRADGNLHDDSGSWFEQLRNDNHHWLIVFRDISNPTNQRTSIFTTIQGTAVSNKAPLLKIDYTKWLHAIRGITNATNERTMITDNIPRSAAGNSAPIINYEDGCAIASALVLANMNSLPLDWAARFSVGGSNLNFFIVKQLPVLPPEAYLERMGSGSMTYAEFIVPRVLELTYTADDLNGFARDLGYVGPPFPWNEQRRHCLQCELDAIYAHLYRLERSELEWILDAPPPSSSFPTLKRKEMNEFGEYRTQRYVLEAYDQLERGEIPNLESESV